jgi:CDP-diacylglycerol--serine O-phosphatidyltransferase
MPGPILSQLDLANGLTLIGLLLSVFSSMFAVQGQFYAALICLIYAGIIDLFDGFVARKIQRTELQSQVGKQIDSIVDVCSFGFAPVVFAYCFGLRDPLSVTVLMVYVGAVAMRLAYFNCAGLSLEGSEQYFTGLPTTYAALFIPVTCLASFALPDPLMKIVLDSLYLALAIAMVANFKMLKLRGIWYGIFSLIAIAGTGIYAWAIAVGL